MRNGLIVDLFAGGGGASTGIEAALGRPVDIAINHDPIALAVHAANHPGTLHRVESVWAAQPKIVTRGRKVDLLWASPDCKHFSRSKGGKPKDAGIRSLAWVVVDWARDVRPAVICLENVEEFRTWGPLDANGDPIEARAGETFNQWVGCLELLGYRVQFRSLVASDYGTPQKRTRLFMIARCDGLPIAWPDPSHGPGLLPVHTAGECIDWSLDVPSIFDRPCPLATATLNRIAAGIFKFVIGNPRPYVVPQGYAPTLIQTGRGERKGQRPRYLDLNRPLGTVEAGGVKHAVVAAFLAKYNGDPLRKSGGGRVVGSALDRPIGTITAIDHHGLVTAQLEPGPRAEKVCAFLVKYYKTAIGQSLHEPMHTLTTHDRMALVTVNGAERPISDIGLRMLQRPELKRAQFGRFAESYDMSAAPKQKDGQRLIGNSVCPEVAEAVVRANFSQVEPGLRRAA